MTKSIRIALAGLLAAPMLALGIVTVVQPASAQALNIQQGVNTAQSNNGATCLFTGVNGCTDGMFTKIINTALFIIGAISVLMLIYGGVRYTLSAGDSKAVTDAKNTILYAIIGIIVALLAFAVVNFVIGAFGSNS